MDIDFFAIGANMFLDVFDNLTGVDNTLVIPNVLGRQLGREQIVVGLSQEAFKGRSQRVAIPLVSENKPALKVLVEQVHRQAFNHGAVAGLRLQ